MKTYFLQLFTALLILPVLTFAQGVAINTDNSEADPSAVLDIKSNDKGLLIPRMTQSEIEAITDPANGLLVFSTDDDNFYVFIQSENIWKELALAIPVWSCGEILTDSRDNQTYATVQIGTQCWMAENLNIGTVINGSGNQTNNGTIEKYCYDNNTANCDEYGGLYQWNEMMEYTTLEGTQGICPAGWYVPADNEWETLITFLGGESVAGGEMKSTRTDPDAHPRWNSPNTGANNNSGFTAFPGGSRTYYATFPNNLGANSLWWSSSQNGSNHAWLKILEYSSAQTYTTYGDKSTGMTVRCLKD